MLYRSPGRGAVPGYAVVRQERDIDLAQGRNAVRFADVAALIDPTTVVFESLTDAQGHDGARAELPVRSGQHRQTAAEVISIGRSRSSRFARQRTETFNGTLLSTQGGIVLRRDDGTVQIVPHNAGVQPARAARRTDHASDAGVGRRRRNASAVHTHPGLISDAGA